MLRSCRLSLLCLTVCYKRNKREAVGLPVLTGASCGRSRHMGLCLIGLLRSKKSRVSACGSVCYHAQALDCVLFRVFSLSPLIVRDDFLYRIWTARFAHSLCRYVSVRLYVEKRHEIKFKRALFPFGFLDVVFQENIFRLIDLRELLFSVRFLWSISIIFEQLQISERRKEARN